MRPVTPKGLPPTWAGRDRLAREAISQGVQEVAERYELPVDDVRDIVLKYHAEIVRRRRMEAT